MISFYGKIKNIKSGQPSFNKFEVRVFAINELKYVHEPDEQSYCLHVS